jgi:hypothetical protein
VVNCFPKLPYRPGIAKKSGTSQERHEALNSESMLKNLFLHQPQRLDAMIQLEDRMKVRFPDRYKKSTLAAIAVEIQKLEIGEQWMRANFGNMPCVIAESWEPQSSLAKTMAKFDVVDRNLMRKAAMLCVEMINEGMGDQVEAVLREFRAREERGAAEAADERAVPPLIADVT